MTPDRRIAFLVLAGLFVGTATAQTVNVPDGFVAEHVVTGPFTGQTVGFAFLPDGRPLVIELKTGVVRVAAVGSAVADSVLTVPNVNGDHPERGLLGVAVDPGWPDRPYVYFHFTHTDSVIHVVMYTASGDLTDPASTAVSLAQPFLLFDDLPDVNGIHNAGTLRFGPDGMLYVAVGDDAFSCMPQNLQAYHGKILRLDVSAMPGAGAGPPPKADITPGDNPFPGPDPIERLVYAWGLRNPFRFTIDAPTGDVFIGSVGSHLFEEINHIPGTGYTGYNFGWPQFEGQQPLNCCGTCGQGNVFTFAIHEIPHPAGSVTVIGGPVMRAGGVLAFPPDYAGDYLYFELYGGTGHRLRKTGGVWDFAPEAPGQVGPTTWCDGLIGIADAQLGPDGALWMAALGYTAGFPTGLHRIRPDTTVTAAPAVSSASGGLRAYPNPVRSGDGMTLSWTTDRAARATVRLFDAAGRLVRGPESVAGSPGSAGRLRWDAASEDGAPLPAGVYFVRVDTPGGPEQAARVVVLRR